MKKIVVILAGVLICGSGIAQINTLTPREKKQGWRLLFNGENLTGWREVKQDTPPEKGWEVENGILTVNRDGDRKGGDIITRETFSDFDLIVEFRITRGANSGIKYLFTKYEQGGWLGLEYQILDDETHPDARMGRDGNRLQAGLYDMFPPAKSKKDRPPGEWNQARIIAKGAKVEHYLNGKKVLTFDRKSNRYRKSFALSKYKDCRPMFGDVAKGHILLQDHHDEVSFRNIKIRTP